jgi:N-methylhydantoinase B
VIPPAVGVISGIDPRTQAPFVNQIFLGMTGGAGAPQADAWLTIGHVGNAGLCNIDSVELDELRQPIQIHSRRLLVDTEGAGRFRGAPSLAVEFGPVGCEISVGYVSDGVTNAAKGVRGGANGGGANQFRLLADGRKEPLDACAQVSLREGERIVSISCGGGGYGAPIEREAIAVWQDVQEGWISTERAKTAYGVALGREGSVDEAATGALREVLGAKRKGASRVATGEGE